MTLYTAAGSLPHHVYCHVESSYVRQDGNGVEPGVWFALRAYPSRAWGCHIMLECGAIVRDIPLHALCQGDDPPEWTIQQAQHWDCYGYQFSTHAYSFLHGLEAEARCADGLEQGDYLFTVIPVGDGYTAEPGQSKEFVFLKLHNGRFTAQPTNRVLFRDRSFTDRNATWPTDVKRQDEVWACETG